MKEQGAGVVEGGLLNNENLTEAILGVDAVVHMPDQFLGGISEEVARAVNLNMNVKRSCIEDDILMPAKLIHPNYEAKDMRAL